MANKKFCPNCNKIISAESKFCEYCGSSLPDSARDRELENPTTQTDQTSTLNAHAIEYQGQKKFCPLCERFVSPIARDSGRATIFALISIIGIVITLLHNSALSGTYNSFTGTYTLSFAEGMLNALLTFAFDIFIIVLFASAIYLLQARTEEKRCPICHAGLS